MSLQTDVAHVYASAAVLPVLASELVGIGSFERNTGPPETCLRIAQVWR